jgi:DNA-nicking Smr family endonuclease
MRWIYEKEVASKILTVALAGASYGGDGAFFVYLRKNKI